MSPSFPPPPSTDRLLVEKRGNDVVVATLNRPEARNAFSLEFWRAFDVLLGELEHDTPARALVLTGAGGFFSSGGDIKIGPAGGEGALASATRLEWGQRVIARLTRLPIPVIAAIEGSAWGMGWSLALAADIVIAADDATFVAPFVEVGLTPDGGLAWFLSHRLGRQRAADLLLSGRLVAAQEALELGLVSRLAPRGDALAHALALAGELGAGNRHAVELTKRLLQAAESGDLAACHTVELAYCAVLQRGDELPRARAAFQARRAAKNKD